MEVKEQVKMTCSDLINSYFQEYLTEWAEEAHWRNIYFAQDDLPRDLIENAEFDGIVITDKDDFDWDKELMNFYNFTEKGLS